MRKSLVIDAGVQKQLLALPREQRAAVVLKLLELGEVFGKPHEHSGFGVRKLRADLFEFRVGLSLRVLFRVTQDVLIVRFVGNHDEVQNYLLAL